MEKCKKCGCERKNHDEGQGACFTHNEMENVFCLSFEM